MSDTEYAKEVSLADVLVRDEFKDHSLRDSHRRSPFHPQYSSGLLAKVAQNGLDNDAGRSAEIEADLVSRGVEAWFDVDSHACFVVDAAGRLFDTNPAADELLQAETVTVLDGLLSFRGAEADEALACALRAIGRDNLDRTRVVVRGVDQVWRSLEVRPALGDTPLLFVTVRAQARSEGMAMGPLAEAFRLTPAQTRVMVGLADGMVPKEIGRRMGVSTHTVRTHLRAIYGKLRVRGIAGALRLTAQLLD